MLCHSAHCKGINITDLSGKPMIGWILGYNVACIDVCLDMSNLVLQNAIKTHEEISSVVLPSLLLMGSISTTIILVALLLLNSNANPIFSSDTIAVRTVNLAEVSKIEPQSDMVGNG